MKPTHSKRLTRTYKQHINGSPNEVFVLLCPVRESEWLADWADAFEMIHSESGIAEEGCVFRTRVAGRPETIWFISRHDPVARVIEFVRVTTGLAATRLRIQVEPEGEGSCFVDIEYMLTPLCEAGETFLDENFSEETFAKGMAWWEASMNHWLRTGETLHPES